MKLPTINLYQEVLKPTREWLDFSRVVIYVAGVALVLTGSGLLLHLQQQSVANKVSLLQESNRLLKEKVDALEASTPKPVLDTGLEQKINRLEQSLHAKKQVMNYLAGRTMGNRQGFGQHLRQLARQEYPNLWLTQLEIRNGGTDVAMAGRMYQEDAVFSLISALGQESQYRSIAFPYFQVGRISLASKGKEDKNAPDTLRFALATQLQRLTVVWDSDLTANEITNAAIKEVQGFQDSKKEIKDSFKNIGLGKGGNK